MLLLIEIIGNELLSNNFSYKGFRMNVGAKIKIKREELGMSVQELSDKIGMTRQNVYNLEGQTHIHTKTLQSLCKILKTDLYWFLCDDTEDYLIKKEENRKERLNQRIKDVESMIRILDRELIELKELRKKL